MTELTRRTFIGGVAAAAGAAAAASVSPAAAAQAAIPATPARLGKQRLHGDIRDIKHVVILMQENRSFDHYFGSLRGVRGFADGATITLPGGLPVWQQPTTRPGTPITTTQFLWRLSAAAPTDYPAAHQPPDSEAGAQGYGGTPHGWDDQHGAWYGGWMNGWVFAKGGLTTLGYLNRADIPFHYALADAYTVGDAYHCSVLSATGPNRTYLWSGTIDAQRKFSDFVAFSGGDELGKFLKWQSYPETLQAAGVSWKTYQGSDNFGDNGAEYFATFAQFDPEQGGTPAPGNVFYDKGVSIVPEPFDANARNGDNLALAQFLEKWTTAIGTPAIYPNISNWRRSVCGDLLSAFDFGSPVFGLPDLPIPPAPIGDPPGGAYHPPATTNQMPVQESGRKRARPLPSQPNANLDGFTFGAGGAVTANLSFSNSGLHAGRASHFAVYSNVAQDLNLVDYPSTYPGQYTVEGSRTICNKTVPGSVDVGAGHGEGKYDLTVLGPNRFLRHFTGDVNAAGATAQVAAAYHQGGFGLRPRLILSLINNGPAAVTFTVTVNNYGKDRPRAFRVPAHGRATHETDPLTSSGGWYDLSVAIGGDGSWSRRYTGHLEDGRNSITG